MRKCQSCTHSSQGRDQLPDKKQPEGRNVCVVLNGYTPVWQGSQGSRALRELGSTGLRRQREGNVTRSSNQPPMDLLPSSKVPLLKVPWSPQTTPPSGDQMLNHMGLSGTFHIQTVTTQIKFSFFGKRHVWARS